MKKKIIFVLTTAMLLISPVMLSSGGDEEENEPVQNNSDGNVKTESKYTVSYSSDFGVAPQSLTVKEGDKLTSGDLKPLDTDGYIFLGWYNGSNQVEEGFVVKQDLKLVAKWTQGSSKKDGEINGSPDDIDNQDEVPTDIVGEDNARTVGEYQNTPKEGEDETYPNAGDYIDNAQTDVNNN